MSPKATRHDDIVNPRQRRFNEFSSSNIEFKHYDTRALQLNFSDGLHVQ